ncbi:hypothetical protein DFH09DRAFT_1326099 [Mycena vulgaris]|nr:hypothetical protein DFH09DRAFT_1326099 [Mycena vulgaris]
MGHTLGNRPNWAPIRADLPAWLSVWLYRPTRKYGVGWDGTVLEASASGTSKAPSTNVSTNALVPRTPGGVLICTDINFIGTCGFAVQPFNTCISFTAPWYQSISNFGSDPGATCIAVAKITCNDDEARW